MSENTVEQSTPETNENQPQQYAVLPVNIMEGVLQYLTSKPWGETDALIKAIKGNVRVVKAEDVTEVES